MTMSVVEIEIEIFLTFIKQTNFIHLILSLFKKTSKSTQRASNDDNLFLKFAYNISFYKIIV